MKGPRSFNVNVLGGRDATIQITYVDLSSLDQGIDLGEQPLTALLTCRGKDHDLTADQFEALANACHRAAQAIRADEKDRAR